MQAESEQPLVGNPSPNQEALAVVEQFAEQVETSPAIEPYENDPLYRSMMSRFQHGNGIKDWPNGAVD